MPFTINSNDLPAYISRQAPAVRARWIAIFNRVLEEHGEEMAYIVANKWLVKLSKENKVSMVAKSLKTRKVTFDLDMEGGYIKRSSDGEDYVSFVLARTELNGHGETYTPELLQKWADKINRGETLVGDFDHEEYDKIMMTANTDDDVKRMFAKKQGIAKALRAVYDKGKLWIRAMIDKRYRKAIKKSKASLEARIPESAWNGNIATDGTLLGFTFMLNGEASDKGAVVV